MANDFYRGKKVLLTGHTGFKGTWLSLMLEQLGAQLSGYALAPDSHFYTDVKPAIVNNYEGQITNRELMAKAMQEVQPEIVIHFASHSTLNRSYEITDYIFDTNVMGVVNLLEAVRRTPSVKAVLIVTSDKCYRNLESKEPYGEDSALGAQDPYSASKACQELVAECYRKSFFGKEQCNVCIATARASNVLGGGDYNLDRLLPSLIDSFVSGREAMIRKPNAVRPWQNVLDVLGGYLLLVQKMLEDGRADSAYCSAFNFGPNEDGFISVGEVAEKLSVLFPEGSYAVGENTEAVKETTILKISSAKAKEVLGWRQRYTIDDTLKMTAEFAIREKAEESTRDICMDFIANYLNK